MFFPERGASMAEVKRLCAGCAVREQCLHTALADPKLLGVWGGVSERGRRQLRRGSAVA